MTLPPQEDNLYRFSVYQHILTFDSFENLERLVKHLDVVNTIVQGVLIDPVNREYVAILWSWDQFSKTQRNQVYFFAGLMHSQLNELVVVSIDRGLV